MDERATEIIPSATAVRIAHRVVEGCGLFVAIGLPLAFHPYSSAPFEPIKAWLFWGATAIMMLASGLQWLIGRADRRSGTIHPLTVPALAWAVASLIATVTARFPLSLGAPNGPATTLSGVLFFLLLTRELRSGEQLQRLVTAIILGSIPVSLYGLVQAGGLDPLPWVSDSVSPVLSTLGRSNFLGAYLAVVIPLTVWRWVEHRRWRYIAVLLLQVGCLWLTLARAAWLGFLAGTALFLGLLAHRRGDRRLWLAVGLFLVLGSGLLVWMNGFAFPHPADRGTGATPVVVSDLRAATIRTRWMIWTTTWHLIGQRWFRGYGPGTFAAVFALHRPPALADLEGAKGVDDPHNLILSLWMDTGVLGLLAFLALVVQFYRTVFRPGPAASPWDSLRWAAAGAMTASLVEAMFGRGTIVSLAFRMLILALGGSAPRLQK
jgi:O-antigen ligase